MCELAKELRIGNYVHSNIIEDIIQVSVITSEINAKPIPLTEEWLLQLGFWTISAGFDDGMRYIAGFELWKCNDLWLCNKNGVVIKSVHQLQNLYHALTGKELTHQKIN